MRALKVLVIAGLCAAPMMASAFTPRNTSQVRPNVVASVPEPGTLALLLVSIGGMAVSRRRRKDP